MYCADNPLKFIDPNGKDIYFIHSNGKIYRYQTQGNTNYYMYYGKDNKYTMLAKLEKTKNGMVGLPNKTSYYNYALSGQGIKYLSGSAAAGFLGATYTNYQNTGVVTKANQFMTSDWKHSDKKVGVSCVDIQYVSVNGNNSKQADTRNGDVDKSKSESLTNQFRQFGFDGRQKGGNFLTANGDNTGAELNNTLYYQGHQNHIHIQDYNSNHVQNSFVQENNDDAE